ncbi:MAG: PEP-CTERM sorting domain-containing protein [Planctomycetaceae bacterium]
MFKFRVLASIGLLVACCNSASAGMIFTSVSRSVSAGSNSALNTTTGVFNQSFNSASFMASAFQDTNVTVNSLSGNGSVVRWISTLDTAYSGFIVDFDLLQPHSFTLTSNLRAVSPGSAGLGLVATTGSITPDGSPIVATVGVFSSSSTLAFSTSGILGPGSYQFSMAADMVIPFASTSSASYDFDFDVAPLASVPEPASLMLVAMGILGLPFVRRKRR